MKSKDMKQKFKCSKCGHEWKGRKEDKPISCPRCKRYDWDKIINKSKKGGKK